MEAKHNLRRALGLTCFTVGLLVGMFIVTTTAWADMEANFYGFSRFYVGNLKTLSCPAYLNRGETGKIAVKLHNATDKAIRPVVLVRLSTPLVNDEIKEPVELAAGETQRVTFPISARNVDLGFFIFAHVVTYPEYKTPMSEAMCGVFVLNLPFLTGQQIYFGLLAACLVCLGFGLWLWDTSRMPEISRLPQVRMAIRFLVVVVLVGLVSSAMGAWLLGVLALILVVMTMSSILYLVTTG